MTPHDYSTTEVTSKNFRPHGSVEFSASGNILTSKVFGPFNVELVQTVPLVGANDFAAFVRRGKWGDIIVFVGNALASPEALTALGESLRHRATHGRLPHATALVLSPEVEGAQLMAPHYLRCFQDHAYTAAQIPIAEFHDYDTARAWLSSTLIALP